MENDGKHPGAAATTTCNRVKDTDFLLQWGNRKRLRCLKVKEEEKQHHQKDVAEKEKSNNNGGGGVIRKKITSRIDRRVVKTAEKDSSSSSPSRLPPNPHNSNNNDKNCDRSNRKQSSSPEKEERYYTTRGSVGLDENGKNLMDLALGVEEKKKAIVWPKLFISLTSKEKEEDFMAMKGCKLPQRPKKRAKFIQKNLLLVSPGAWLSDLCQERYEVREKKTSKKRPRGLKAMGSMESDSE